ncbi:hypothetical protein D3C73_573470 [compost metagenome]
MQAAPLESQLQQADDGIHGGAYFMTHGRQKGRFGTIGLLSLLAGHRQFIQQTHALAHIDPAANPPLNIAIQVVIRLNPVINIHHACRHDQPMVSFLRESRLTGESQVCNQGGKKGPTLAIFIQTCTQQSGFGFTKETRIAAVAEEQASILVPRINWMRCPVHQIGDELELGAQCPLHQPPLTNLLAQRQTPQADPDGQQQDK